MLLSQFVFHTYTTLPPIHRVSFITGIVRTMNLSVSHTVSSKKIKAAHSLPWKENWKKACFPNIRDTLLLKEKSFFAGFWSCCGAEEGGRLLISERLPDNCPDNSRRTNEHRALNCCGSVRYWAKAELLLSRFCDWGVDYEPYQLFSQPFDGLMELDWVHDSTVETSKAE